nr:hypothetical protein [Brevibacillus laterosporus]
MKKAFLHKEASVYKLLLLINSQLFSSPVFFIFVIMVLKPIKGVLRTMDALFDQLKEYLNMDTEISLPEFDKYYKEVLVFLDSEWTNMTEEDTMRMIFILDNLKANSEDRSKRKGKEAKKFAKIAERTNIWAQVMIKRMKEFGVNDEEIGKRYEAIYEAV